MMTNINKQINLWLNCKRLPKQYAFRAIFPTTACYCTIILASTQKELKAPSHL